MTLEKAKGRIEVRAVNEGMRLSDISGDLSAETTNGSIILDRIDSGNVDLYAVNGNISFDGPIKDKGLYRLTTHNGLMAMAVPEKANVTMTVRTYNGGFQSTFQVPGDTGERRKRFTMTLGNGSAHVELESFGGTISLRRPGEPRPETERRQRRDRDKASLKLDLKGLAHLDIDQTVREAMAEAQAAMPQALAEAQAAIPQAIAEAQAAIPQAIEEAMASIPQAMEEAMRELDWAISVRTLESAPNPESAAQSADPNPNAESRTRHRTRMPVPRPSAATERLGVSALAPRSRVAVRATDRPDTGSRRSGAMLASGSSTKRRSPESRVRHESVPARRCV